MGFLTPGMLGLLGLGAVPVIIHLLHRRRYQVVRWPAMQFLLRAQVKTKQRLRLENLLLLLLRTLAVLLFAIVASRPFLPSARALGVLGPERRHLYLLVDNSASMGYQEGMTPLLQRAKSAAEAAVRALRSDDPVTACEDRARAVLRGLLGPAARDEVLVTCDVEGTPPNVRAHADGRLVPWWPGLPALGFATDASSVREELP